MPDYQIKCWDMSTLDFNIPFLKQAYEHKNWAFVTDYMRFYILWKEGGIYLDSDVEVYKRFDDFLSHSMFSGIEYEEKLFRKTGVRFVDKNGDLLAPMSYDKSFGVAIEAAILGAQKGHPYMKACVEYYQSRTYLNEDGTIFRKECPVVMVEQAIPFGFRYKNTRQELNTGICLYPYPTFIYGEGYEELGAYARHWRNGSWRDKTEMSRIYKWLKRFHLESWYRWLERTPGVYGVYRTISRKLNSK